MCVCARCVLRFVFKCASVGVTACVVCMYVCMCVCFLVTDYKGNARGRCWEAIFQTRSGRGQIHRSGWRSTRPRPSSTTLARLSNAAKDCAMLITVSSGPLAQDNKVLEKAPRLPGEPVSSPQPEWCWACAKSREHELGSTKEDARGVVRRSSGLKA